MECGLVGLPNVGKSTLFNALTAKAMAQAANYPFCTVEPNRDSVAVPDHRLNVLADLAKSKKIIPTSITFVDIAGLVKGASQGEGLGNEFLGHIRRVSAILHVVRCFEGTDIIHVEGRVDPIHDIGIIETELMLADLQSITKRRGAKKKHVDEKYDKLLDKAEKALSNWAFASTAPWTEEERPLLKQLDLLTLLPMIYVCNTLEGQEDSPLVHTVRNHVKASPMNAPVLTISAHMESELSQFSPDERTAFFQSTPMAESGLDRLIREAYAHLNLHTFFTVGPEETRAWTIPKGTIALDAARVIHTDFQRGFIRAETIAYDDYITYKTPAEIKSAGRLRAEGKDYVVQDGDILFFRHNV